MIAWWWTVLAFCLGIGTGMVVGTVSYHLALVLGAARRGQYDEPATRLTEAELDRRLDQMARELEE